MNIKKILGALMVALLVVTMAIPFSATAANTNYVSNRSPLIDTPYVPLPL
jgi:hypothetical protein